MKLEYQEIIEYEITSKNTNIKKAIEKTEMNIEEIANSLWHAKGATELIECLAEENFTQSITAIIEIAEMCNVSTDYILGLTENEKQNWTEDSPYRTHQYE